MTLTITKKLLTLLFALFMLSAANAQSKLAQLKFQDAEELFAKDDFAGALLKLDDAEKITGKTNPPMLYLRIQSLNGLFLEDPYQDYKTLESLRKTTATFLQEFENVKGIDDKYRDVYKIGESLSAYPKDYASFATAKTSSKIKKNDATLKEKVATSQIDNAFADYIYFPEFPVGMTLEEAKSNQYKKFLKRTYPDRPVPAEYGGKGSWVSTKDIDFILTPGNRGVTALLVYNNVVCGYSGTIKFIYDGPQFSATTTLTNEVLQEFKTTFGFMPEETQTTDKGFTTNTYTWKKNGKIFVFSSGSGKSKKDYLGMLNLVSFDETLGNK